MSNLKALFDLHGKVALITGGSRGLGMQVAEGLGEFGASVVLAARNKGELDEAVGRLAAMGIEAHAIVADVGSRESVVALVDQVVATMGTIDILVNNAGTTWGAPAESYPLEGWNKVMNLNVTGMFLLTQEVASRCFLPRGRGVILNVASIEGLQGHPARRGGTIAYNAAKGAVVNMTRALAAEWGGKGIRVNALAPGFFPSKLTAATLQLHGDDLVAGTPLGKLGGDHDLKGAALLLASDAGGHITGHVLVVDGGMTII